MTNPPQPQPDEVTPSANRPRVTIATTATEIPPSLSQVAEHINEFGDLEANVVHVVHSDESDREQEEPVFAARFDPDNPHKPRRRDHISRAMRRLFRRRTLMQYFYNDVLFRSRVSRHVSREELFLDLVLVAAIATMGHHLREQDISWANMENFLLLFAVIYSAWRQIVLLWNFWGVKEDMLDKLGIYFTFVFIIGISLGSYQPFSDRARAYVGISAFLASFIPLAESFTWARLDSILKIPTNRTNTITVGAFLSTLALLPLVAAAFVNTERTAKVLFWVSIGLQAFMTAPPTFIIRYLHRKNSMFSRPAISIEHAVEKFEVLSMIFMGEVVIALLSEGAPLVYNKKSNAGLIYLAAFLCTGMLYSFQTLYAQVDNRILRRGKHALRYDARHGLVWAFVHMPYHLSLVLLATGIGLALRDIGIPPLSDIRAAQDSLNESGANEVVHAVARAAGAYAVPGKPHFTRAARWLLSVGWGSTLVCSALLSFSHVGGPRAATKNYRLGIRCAFAIGLMVGLPFSGLNAMQFIAVLTGVSVAFALAEFLLVQLDRIGLFRSEPRGSRGSNMDGGVGAAQKQKGVQVRDVGQSSDSSSEESGDESLTQVPNLEEVMQATGMQGRRPTGDNQARSGVEATLSAPELSERPSEVPEAVAQALQRRLTRGNTSRLVAIAQPGEWSKRRHGLG